MRAHYEQVITRYYNILSIGMDLEVFSLITSLPTPLPRDLVTSQKLWVYAPIQ